MSHASDFSCQYVGAVWVSVNRKSRASSSLLPVYSDDVNVAAPLASDLLASLKHQTHISAAPIPRNPCVLAAVSNLKPALSCGEARRLIDNWKVKRRWLIFDSVAVLTTTAPRRTAGSGLLLLMWGSRRIKAAAGLSRVSIPPFTRPGFNAHLRDGWGGGARFSHSRSILSLSSWAESQPRCS